LNQHYELEINKESIPYKDAWYINRRYFKHPVYNYLVWGIEDEQQLTKAVIIGREIQLNNSKILRIIDYIGEQSMLSGLYDEFGKLIEVFMRSQSSSSYGTATLLADNHIHNNVYKINPTTPSKLYSLDGVNRIGLLKSLADETARYEIAELRKRGFFTERADPFSQIPISR
jgi:hypothetical protein